MSKILIIYGSTTGTTEMVSEQIEAGLVESGHDVVRKNVVEATISDLTDFKFIVFGCSTWDYGCLQYDFEIFHEQLKLANLDGKQVAIFGIGDKSYGDTYCESNRTIEATVKSIGGNLICDNLEVECDLTNERLQQAKDWAANLGKMI